MRLNIEHKDCPHRNFCTSIQLMNKNDNSVVLCYDMDRLRLNVSVLSSQISRLTLLLERAVFMLKEETDNLTRINQRIALLSLEDTNPQ